MKTKQRILVIHPEAEMGQSWLQALARVGYETVMVSTENEAARVFDSMPIDLVLMAEGSDSEASFDFAGEIRQLQPEVRVVMVLRELELSQVVQGIRHGLSDVLPSGMEIEPIVERVQGLLGMERKREHTADEVAAAEATLAQLDPNYRGEANQNPERQEVGERSLDQQLRELNAQRDQVAAAQAAVDEKARQLAREREAMQRECRELKAERIQWEQTLSELEVREENLRVFEQTLRTKQEKIETELSMDRSKLPGTAIDLAQAWETYNLAAKTLAAEKAVFRDERMVLTDLDKKVKEGKARLAELEAQLSGHELKRRGLPPPPPKGFVSSQSKTRAPMKVGFFRSILGGAR